MKDKNGIKIKIGDSVDVPYTEDNFEFRGTVDSFSNGCVIVEDMEGEFFSLEPQLLEVIDEEKENAENHMAIDKYKYLTSKN